MQQLSKYIQLITNIMNIEGLKFGNELVRNFDKDKGRVGYTDRGRIGLWMACHGSNNSNRDTYSIGTNIIPGSRQ